MKYKWKTPVRVIVSLQFLFNCVNLAILFQRLYVIALQVGNRYNLLYAPEDEILSGRCEYSVEEIQVKLPITLFAVTIIFIQVYTDIRLLMAMEEENPNVNPHGIIKKVKWWQSSLFFLFLGKPCAYAFPNSNYFTALLIIAGIRVIFLMIASKYINELMTAWLTMLFGTADLKSFKCTPDEIISKETNPKSPEVTDLTSSFPMEHKVWREKPEEVTIAVAKGAAGENCGCE